MGHIRISHSVGNDMSNFYNDVKTVQKLLNAHNITLSPLPILPENGKISPQMISNIREFQRRVVKMSVPDGRVTPGGETFKALANVPMTSSSLTQAATMGAGIGSQVFIHGKTLVNINGTPMYVSGSPQAGMRIPRTGTTSVLFIFKKDNPNKLYRLDYDTLKSGPNMGKKGWEHNQKGVAKILDLKVTNHQPGGKGAALAGRSIGVLRYGGKALVVVGLFNAGVEFYYAQDRTRVVVKHGGGMAGAWAGARVGAKGGAAIAAIGGQFGPQVAVPEEVVTVPVGAIIGGVVGGVAGFWGGEKLATTVYDRVYIPVREEEWMVLDEAPPSAN